jgi:DNA polymerase-3 subunit gamma/tau
MVLVRIAYAADMPTPDEVVRALGAEGGAVAVPQGNGGGMTTTQAVTQGYAPRHEGPRGGPRASAAASPRALDAPMARDDAAVAPTVTIASFAELIALAQEKRDIGMKMALERDVRLVHCEDCRLEIALEPSAPKTLVHDLSRKLSNWTGKRWIVVVSKERGAPTMRAQADAREADLRRDVENDPLVQAVMEKFPGATIENVTQRPPELEPGADEALTDPEQED